MTLDVRVPQAPAGVETIVGHLPALWPFVEHVAWQFGLVPELLLALICAETAAVPDVHLFIVMSDKGLECLERWYPARDPNPTTLAELSYAAAHLYRQCRRFGRLTLALAAFHTDPEWVADQGEALLDEPEMRDYLRYFFASLAWLSETQPWRRWDVCPPPIEPTREA